MPIGEKSHFWRSGKIEVICQYCGTHFKVYPSKIKNGGGKYHTRECHRLSRIGKKLSEKSIRKRTESRKDFKHSEETIIKQSGKNSVHWKGGIKEQRKRVKEKRKNNLQYQLNNRFSNYIRKCLKTGIKNGRTWQSLVGYTYKQLKKHLKSTMPFGYTWQDFLNGDLHIDHIIPISAFEFNKPEDFGFKQAWRLDNLRLLKAEENCRKKDKLIKPLQTNFKIVI